MRGFVSTALLLILIAAPTQAQDFSRIEFEIIPLSDTVSLVTSHAGGNLAACHGPDGLLLIDADYVELSDKLKIALAEVAGPDNDAVPRLVINTHWHFDHTGGNGTLAEAGSVIMAHASVQTRLAAGQLITIIDHQVEPAPEAAWPTQFIDKKHELKFNGQTIVCTHMPHAHTDGDVTVRFVEANVVHTGDLVFYAGYPFVDISSEGDIDGVIAAVTTILSWCDDETRIIPGHGPLTDKAGLTGYLQMLKDFRAAIAAEIAAGKDLQAIQAGDATAAIDAEWDGKMFPSVMFKEMVYLSLTAK